MKRITLLFVLLAGLCMLPACQQDEAAMMVLGNISTGQQDLGYALIRRSNEDDPFLVAAGGLGNHWY